MSQRLLRTLSSSLSHERTQVSSFFLPSAFRNLLSIIHVTRRFYTPSLTTSQLQQTTTGGSTNNGAITSSQDNAVKIEDIDRRSRPGRPLRGHYHLLSAKRPRWTEEEKDLLVKLVRQGYTSYDVRTHFPLRTICSLDTRMARLRTEEHNKGTFVKKPRLSVQKSAWGVKEDEWLVKRLEEYGFKDRELKDVSWPEIANGTVNGKGLGRTATSCKRRWAIIDPSSERFRGAWLKEELERLEKAVRVQVPSPESVAAETKSDSTVVVNKLGLPLHGDHMAAVDWDKVSKLVETRSGVQCRSHAFKTLASGVEGRWNEFETERLVKGVEAYGHDWHRVAAIVGTRSAFQARQKYFLQVDKLKRQAKQKQQAKKL